MLDPEELPAAVLDTGVLELETALEDELGAAMLELASVVDAFVDEELEVIEAAAELALDRRLDAFMEADTLEGTVDEVVEAGADADADEGAGACACVLPLLP